jgi:hypothetical protein
LLQYFAEREEGMLGKIGLGEHFAIAGGDCGRDCGLSAGRGVR